MAINKTKVRRKGKLIFLIGILGTVIFTTIANKSTLSNYHDELNERITNESGLKLSRQELIDKVYNFTPNEENYDDIAFIISFEAEYFYYISFGIVTPHSCDVNISLKDPDGDPYYLFDSRDSDYPNLKMQQYYYLNIPFGVAISGDYQLDFIVYLNCSLNIHINVRRAYFKCLEDILPSCEWDHRILYYVDKCEDKTFKVHYRELKTDTYYRFYFARVSPIENASNYVSIDYKLTSSNNINYTIYKGENLPTMSISQDYLYPDCLTDEFELSEGIPNLYDVIKFDFGITVEGVYKFDMTIHCEVETVNIAFAIVELNDISDIIDPITGENKTEPENTPETNSTGAIFSVPPEYTVGFLAFMGTFAGILVGIVLYHRKRTVSGLNI
ncbi:MAG: hypothetical protein ACFE9T_01000 [Promethearchaeota archaeon]